MKLTKSKTIKAMLYVLQTLALLLPISGIGEINLSTVIWICKMPLP